MKRRAALSALGGIGLSAAYALSGCQSRDSGRSGGATGAKGKPLELTFWHTQTQENKQALETLCRRFSDENGSGIAVKPIWQGNYKQLNQKLMGNIIARQLPDLSVAYESMVSEFMKADAVVPLDDYLSSPNGLSHEDLEDIFPAFLETNRFKQFDNQLLSFPFTKSLLVNYVNVDALKQAGFPEPPKTWAEFEEAARKMSRPRKGDPDEGGRPATHGLAVDVNASTIDGWILSQGGKLLDDTGAAFDSPETLAVFRTIDRLIESNAAYQTRGDVYQADFGGQRAGMICTSSTQRFLFRPLINDKFEWRLTMIPQANPTRPVTVLYGANLCVFRSTPERQEAAWEFLRWLSQKEQAAYWSVHSSYMPIRKSVAETPEMKEAWKKDPQGKQAFDLIRYARKEPNVRGWQETRDYIEEAMQAVISDAKTPEAAVAELDRKADEALKKAG